MALGTYLISQSAADGAMPTLYAATSPQATNGSFYGPTKRFGMVGPPGPSSYKKVADDQKVQQRLWARIGTPHRRHVADLNRSTSARPASTRRGLPVHAGEVGRVGAEEPLVFRWRHRCVDGAAAPDRSST